MDFRHINAGWEIPSEGYCDQPYVVKTNDGAWLCIMTTGPGHEGQHGQHVVSMRSTDCGRTWEEPVALEPNDGPEASYAVMLKVPSGRIYAFYNHNTDNIREVTSADGKPVRRVDSLGHFVFKYTDDHGRSWSAERCDIPQRITEIDRESVYGGKVLFFWNVGKPFILEGTTYVSLHKVGNFGSGFFTRNEGVLLASPNLLTEPDPRKITWETLPEGDLGIRTPAGGGPIASEQSYSVMSDHSIYVCYRTTDGHPGETYSRDHGRSFEPPHYKVYADGRLMKHPRAANFTWKCTNGKFLYWFHNHGGKGYPDRNPVWLCMGEGADSETGRVIRWSQPEVLLYHPDPHTRMSYPDLIEQDGRYYVTETQKEIARTHQIPASFLDVLFAQFAIDTVAPGAVLDATHPETGVVPMPALAPFVDSRENRDRHEPGHALSGAPGITIEARLRFPRTCEFRTLLDTRTENGTGLALELTEAGSLRITVNDGWAESAWHCDPAMVTPGMHHVGVVLDMLPGIVTFIIDGKLDDGGTYRQFGWGRLNRDLRHANGADTLTIDPAVRSVRIYDRPLMTTEVIGNYRATRPEALA